MTVTPAYGRDYKSAKAAREAWAAGHDFVIAAPLEESGRYVNRDDYSGSVTIRYGSLRKVTIIPARHG